MANSLTDTIKQCNFKPCYTINSAKKIHDELSLKIKTTRYSHLWSIEISKKNINDIINFTI